MLHLEIHVSRAWTSRALLREEFKWLRRDLQLGTREREGKRGCPLLEDQTQGFIPCQFPFGEGKVLRTQWRVLSSFSLQEHRLPRASQPPHIVWGSGIEDNKKFACLLNEPALLKRRVGQETDWGISLVAGSPRVRVNQNGVRMLIKNKRILL